MCEDGSADLSLFPFPWTEHGLPPLALKDIPTCGGSGMHQPPCTREGVYADIQEKWNSIILTPPIEYFQGFVHHHPVFRPHSTPIYSNTALRLLSYALEAITGNNFDNLMEECVFKPLILNHTSIRKPSDNLGVIPQGDSTWSYSTGDEGA